MADTPQDAETAAREALAKLNWDRMPAYGEVPWWSLKEAVMEAQVGDRHHQSSRWDDNFYIGHQMADINMNSLNRIVSAFARAALRPASSPGEVTEADRERLLCSAIARGFTERGRFGVHMFETDAENEAYKTGLADAGSFIAEDIEAGLPPPLPSTTQTEAGNGEEDWSEDDALMPGGFQ